MSGIVGILNLDGAPVDRELLWRMTQHLAPRGPDAQEIWTEGKVGFGHTLLRTTYEAEHERQPLTLDGSVWITADCRVDAREDLIRELGGHGCVVRRNAPDPELILHAYAVWGEACVEHLLGDFSFAIWDGRRRTLFCARDQIGVKPFMYAHVGETVVFSNTLNAVRLHPAVSNGLDHLAIADYLMFEFSQELNRSCFSDIRRLPAAHVLTVEAGTPRLRRYWELPDEAEIRYRRRGEYVEHFLELLDTATQDRLRGNRVGVLMSGGLDSPTIAVTARRILASKGSPFDLRAHTVVYDRLIPDEERKYSQIAADGIGIPIHHNPVDDYGFPPKKPGPEWYPSEPGSIFDGNTIEIHGKLVAASPVWLTGYGADPLIDLPSVEPMLHQRRYAGLLQDYVWLMWVRRQFVKPGIRTLLRKRFSPRVAEQSPRLSFPDWFQPNIVQQFDLKARWNAWWLPPDSAKRIPCQLCNAFWPFFMEGCDLGMMGLAGELRHPFLDLRMVRYARRLPPFPWFKEKSLLRVAMKGLLPKAILHRPKARLPGNPMALRLPPARTLWWEPLVAQGSGLEDFVDLGVLKDTLARVVSTAQAVAFNDHADVDSLLLSLRPLSLSLWLQRNARVVVSARPDLPSHLKM